jgi:outer membrane receptor protein involved in Fe transport
MKSRNLITLGATLFALAPGLPAQPLAPTPASTPAGEKEDTVKMEDYVVTGVFTATAASKATVSISTLDAKLLNMEVPVSGVDLLLNVPGVFVNSSLGEIRGMVYSRGISANTSDGANGYYYVSLQEDGLPITDVNMSNYGPDYFHRPDATLLRVEAVRGGSASITAANAPGGVFNYISKTGGAAFAGEVRARYGLEGDWSPMYRGDINLGGPIGKSAWRYNVGGFYRVADGYRPPKGYPMNDGGTIRGNIFKEYSNGSVKIYTKYENDRNHWYEYQLGLNPQDPKQVAGLSRYSTNLHEKFTSRYPRESDTNLVNFDSADKVHSQQKVVGVDWKHELPNDWAISNNAKVSRSFEDRNASTSVTPRSLAWPNFFNNQQITFSGGTQNGRVPAGTYRFTNRQTGALMAEVTSNGSYSSSGSAISNPGQIVTYANLPNGGLEIADGSFNGVWTNAANVPTNHVDEFMDQFAVTKTIGKMAFTAGAFFGYADILQRSTTAGRSASPLTEQPSPMAITWIPATATSAPAGTPADALAAVSGWNGHPVLLTDPAGFVNEGVGYGRNEAIAHHLALFFGHKWDITRNWGIDWGFRAENYAVSGFNAGGVQNPRGNWDPTYGGADGDPYTMYDARFTVPNPANKWFFDKNVNSFSWSAASNFVINDQNSFYVRYADGEKAPDYEFFRSYNSQFRLDNLKPRPQTVKQIEGGYRYKTKSLSLVATPFWSRLGDINSNPSATELDGITLYYPDPIYNVVTSWGVELEGEYTFSRELSLRSVVTWQRSRGTVWKEFQAGANGRDDDTYRDFSGKPSDNNPDIMVKTNLNYRLKRFFASLAWKHMGERAGNIANVIVLPRFNQFDLNTSFVVNRRLSLEFTVNNIFDGTGVMTWRGWGVSPGDRQSYTVLPATGARTLLEFVPIPPRAYYLSATYKL